MVFDESDQRRLTEVVVHQILVVDDDPEAAEFYRAVLEAEGYRVVVAKDGGQAHSAFVMRKPDFVILDLILPGVTGYEICERFKQQEKFVPVLVASAIELEDSKDLARRVGCDAYLCKPIPPQLLLSTIREVADQVWRRQHAVGDAPKDKDSQVRFHCRCGKKFKVSPLHRGKSLTCPECGEIVLVPRHD